MVDKLEEKLESLQWLNGQNPSTNDAEVFNAFTEPPEVTTHPYSFAWYALIAHFSPNVRNNWAASPSDGDLKDIIDKIKSMPLRVKPVRKVQAKTETTVVQKQVNTASPEK